MNPQLCITDSADKSCAMVLKFEWQSATTGDYCLVEKESQIALQCWRENRAGQWQEQTTVHDQQIFWMTESGDKVPLAQAAIEVLSTYTEDRRRNRRRKHVWSLL
ncbi:DUF3019 domain-containing protein [Halioxenophilus sp. WMMB6]|uniref:DUF3019 domain-containing protein n=1 Tax=Halioxenophilus sp. WMMB6 TaxID=3073815 RepID=UPI00295E2F55|nr:DUF3019 domain-containing protein [Halioxenophilus sp. WMMB6]